MKMKKYLMTGIAALALCAGFTSCSHDLEPMSQDEINQMEAQKITQNYEKAFMATFGKPASNKDWGFGVKSTRTRGNASTNANEWGATYNVPIELTEQQKIRVRAYFQHNKLSDGGTKNWSEFFIQQVYEGGTNPLVRRGSENPNNYSTEEYQGANGTWYDAGDQMDYLVVNNNPEHVNNFNSAHGSMNNTVLNTPDVKYLTDHNNGYHSDEIQLMVDSKATAFGYHNSQANKYYYDHYAMVDGSDIDEWADDWARDHGETFGTSVTGRYFVGLDFDMLQPEDCYSNNTIKASEWKSGINYLWNKNGEGDEDDTFTEWSGADEPFTDALGNTIYRLNDKTNFYHAVAKVTLTDGEMIKDLSGGNQAFNKARIDELISQGYRPTSSNFREWIKVGTCRDYYYSDWIICIAPANPTNVSKANLRVIAEDLTVDNGSPSDFDFNDVVFDVYYGDASTAKVTILAAGGTLELKVNGVEVHQLLGHPGKMINTNGTKSSSASVRALSVDDVPTQDILLGFAVNDAREAKDIQILVNKKSNGVDNWVPLTAERGKAASKVAVEPNYTWNDERVPMPDSFKQYVQAEDDTYDDWWKTKEQNQ